MGASPVAEPPRRSYGSLLRDRRFLPFFLAQSSGDAGYAVYAVSVPWLAYHTGGAVALGLALFVEFGVYALSFAAGPVVDRVDDLRSLLVAGYVGQAALAALLGLLAVRGELTVASLLAVLVPLSAIWDFTWTANNVAPPRIVRPGDLLRANGLLGAVSGGNQIAGFAAGAGLLLLVGPAGGLFLYAALNAAAGLLAVAVHAPRPAGAVADFVASFRDGWRYFLGGLGRPRLQISAASAVEAFVSAAPVLLLTVLASRAAVDPSGTYAAFFTAFALGGVAGSLLLGQFAPRRRLGWVLAGVAASEGPLVIVVVAAASAGAWSAPLWGVLGAVDVAFYTVLLAFFQATTPPPLVGRTVANAYLFRGLARAGGLLVLAAALTVVSPAALALGVGVALGLVGVASLGLPAVRRMGF